MSGDNTFDMDRRSALAAASALAVLPGAALARPAGGAAAAAAQAPLTTGRDQPFDLGWRFHRGTGDGLERPGLNDSGWRQVDLPHDWSIEDAPEANAVGPFVPTAAAGTETGYTVGGEGWYRKHFSLAGVPAGSRVEVAFDGMAVESELWINGVPLGRHVHAYTPFAFDLTPHLVPGGANVLAVRVRNLGRNSRWYAGSGIYRSVRLDVTPAGGRFARWGLGAATSRIAGGDATVAVSATLEGNLGAMTVTARLRGPDGRIVAEGTAPAAAATRLTLAVRNPRLWSPGNPQLHVLEAELREGARVVDRMRDVFGIRIVTIDAAQGLRINGTATKLRGGCIHHDNGLLGACAFEDADERRVRLMKARGYNAIRSSHNPASTSLRRACDRLGMLLIEEAFDMWHAAKLPDDYSRHIRQDWRAAIGAMVLSARNSPSVIMWSIGNEIPERSSPEGIEWCWKFANEVHRLDPTRPVTAALNGVLGPLIQPGALTARRGTAGKADNASTAFLDVAGFNYRLDDIEAEHAAFPERVVYASETFPRDAYDYKQMADRLPYMLGEFVWTAMDYIGEAGVGGTVRQPAGGMPYFAAAYPWVNAWCGDIDLVGRQKAPSLYRDVVWGLSPVEVLVQRPIPEGQREIVSLWGWSDELPSWTWPGQDGKPMAVRIYTAGDQVDLLLNGAKVGSRKLTAADKMRAEFSVPYAGGTLEAVAMRNGAVIGRRQLQSRTAPAQLRLIAEPHRPGTSGRGALTYVAIEVQDAAGRALPDAEHAISVMVEGAAELIALGSANPLASGSFKGTSCKTFRGHALAILRGKGRPGPVRIAVRGAGLAPHALTLHAV